MLVTGGNGFVAVDSAGRDGDCRGVSSAAGDFMWTEDVAIPQLRTLTADLGRRNALTSDKARRVLGFAPRPAADTVVDCARSLRK